MSRHTRSDYRPARRAVAMRMRCSLDRYSGYPDIADRERAARRPDGRPGWPERTNTKFSKLQLYPHGHRADAIQISCGFIFLKVGACSTTGTRTGTTPVHCSTTATKSQNLGSLMLTSKYFGRQFTEIEGPGPKMWLTGRVELLNINLVMCCADSGSKILEKLGIGYPLCIRGRS